MTTAGASIMRKSAQPLQAALWMIASCAFLSSLAGIGRELALAGMHPLQIVFLRLLLAFLCILPWAMAQDLENLKTRRWKLYGLRAAISMGAMTTWFWSAALIPIGELTALSFLAPMFATAGAALVLGETVGLRRWTATLIGFAGALVIVRPGMTELEAGHWLALATALFMGTSVLVIKTLTKTENPNKVVFYMGLYMTPLALIPALFVWEWPVAGLWPWVLAMGPVATLGHVFLVRAYSLAETSAVVPFDYARLPFAVLFGFALFGELIDAWTWVGATIIFVSSIYIARREAGLARRKGM